MKLAPPAEHNLLKPTKNAENLFRFNLLSPQIKKLHRKKYLMFKKHSPLGLASCSDIHLFTDNLKTFSLFLNHSKASLHQFLSNRLSGRVNGEGNTSNYVAALLFDNMCRFLSNSLSSTRDLNHPLAASGQIPL